MKILAVGATGALGRPVVQLLRAKGLAVRALSRPGRRPATWPNSVPRWLRVAITPRAA